MSKLRELKIVVITSLDLDIAIGLLLYSLYCSHDGIECQKSTSVLFLEATGIYQFRVLGSLHGCKRADPLRLYFHSKFSSMLSAVVGHLV